MHKASRHLLVAFMIGGLVLVGARNTAAQEANTESVTFTARVTPESDPSSLGDLALTMTGSPDPVIAGSTLMYMIEVENVGAGDIIDPITVTDELPDGLTFVSGNGGGFKCSAAEQVVTCTRVDPLDAGSMPSSITLEVAVGGAAIPGVTNTASVSTLDDADSSNDTASVTTTVLPGPFADAGPDQNIETAAIVTLDGSGSFDRNGGMITYAWSLENKPGGSTLSSESIEGGDTADPKPPESTLTDEEIEGKDTPNPSLIPDVDGLYIIKLIVSDGKVESEPDLVRITASSDNVAPNARAGRNRRALTATQVTLDGTASYDADEGPDPLTYMWTFKELPEGSALQDGNIGEADKALANFEPDVPGIYVLTLEVSDGEDTDVDEVTITVFEPNVPPNARAGEDQTAFLGDEVVLDGTASNDPDNGPKTLSFDWRFVSVPAGSSLTNDDIAEADAGSTEGEAGTTESGAGTAEANAGMTDRDTENPRFTPDVVGDYVVRLEVSDDAASGFDNVMVTVEEMMVSAVCDADSDEDVDRNDIEAIFRARRTPAEPGDPRDANGDGMINLRDVLICLFKCTNPWCEP